MKLLLLVVACVTAAATLHAQDEAATPARIEALVAGLDAPRFADREAALAALVRLGPGILPLLEPHRDHPSPEARARVAALIDALQLEAILRGLDGAPRELLEALGATDPQARSARVRSLVLRARPTEAFPRLLELARTSRSREVVRAALEGLSRIGAPRMATRLDAQGVGSFGKDAEPVVAYVCGLFENARVSESERTRLADATVPPLTGGRMRPAFVRLVALADTYDFAFVLDAAANRIEIVSPREAIDHWTAWLAGPGRHALAWDDFVRDRIASDADALAAESREAWAPRLLDPDPVMRRKAAFVLGRTPGAEEDLARARDGADDATRAWIDQALDRGRLRAYGDGFLVSNRSGAGQLFRMRLDGAPPRRLTEEASRAYSLEPNPTGTHLAYRYGTWRLATVALATGAVWRAPDGYCHRAAWSPDGRTLAYELRDDHNDRSCDLYLHDVEGGADIHLGAISPDPHGRMILPTWSPDGRHVAFAIDGPDGRAFVVRAATVRHPGLRGPQWTKTDELVAVVEGGPLADRLVRIGVDGMPRGEDLPGFASGKILQVDLSPDGATAVVVHEPGAGARIATHLMPLSRAGELRRLGDLFCACAWSKPGDRLAVCAEGVARVLDRTGEQETVPALTLTTAASGGAQPFWGPDGKALYVGELHPSFGGPSTLQIHALDGPTWRTLATLPGSWGRILTATPDGAWLLVVTDGTGDRDIYAVATSDGRTINLTDHPADDDELRPSFGLGRQ